MTPRTSHVSNELLTWVDLNRSQLRSKIGLLREAQAPGKAAEVLKRVSKDPSLLIQGWRELEAAMDSMDAPSGVRAEAAKLTADIDKHRTGKPLATTQQRELAEFADAVLQATPSILDLQTTVRRAIQDGRLSRPLGEQILQMGQEMHESSGSKETPPRDLGFHWKACSFCAAAAAVEFGPAGAAAACLFCGVLSD